MQGAEFVCCFAPQFEAALGTIQDKYVSLYDHLSGTNPEASIVRPHPRAALAGARSQATTSTSRGQVHEERTRTWMRSNRLFGVIRGHATDLAILQAIGTTASALAELRGLSFKATVNLRAPV
eukprot:6193980-Pleurochrysis_carterae.AAC.4